MYLTGEEEQHLLVFNAISMELLCRGYNEVAKKEKKCTQSPSDQESGKPRQTNCQSQKVTYKRNLSSMRNRRTAAELEGFLRGQRWYLISCVCCLSIKGILPSQLY